MDLNDNEFRAYMGRNCACFNLRKAARLVSQKYDHALKQTGLNANQFSILVAAFDRDGIVLSKLAKGLGMERTTLTRNLSILERMGFVEITPGQDKRERLVSVSESGKEALQEAIPLWRKAQAEMVDQVGEENWESLLTGLQEVSRIV